MFAGIAGTFSPGHVVQLAGTTIRLWTRLQLQRVRLRDHLLDRLHPGRVLDSVWNELVEGVLNRDSIQQGLPIRKPRFIFPLIILFQPPRHRE